VARDNEVNEATSQVSIASQVFTLAAKTVLTMRPRGVFRRNRLYDDELDTVGVFDFDEFANHLLDQGVHASPAQLHGCLTGLLCAGAPTEAEYGLDAVAQALDIDPHGELANRIMQLFCVTAAALQDDDFTFNPLLPDDDAEIAERTAALASWCEGFLTGFAYLIAGEDARGGAVSQEASEVLSDIAAMAQAETGDYEDEDEAENSFAELVEYLRVAVVNVFMERGARRQDEEGADERGHPLH
jgi:yecA family protein